jgi:hypothetical protein
MSDNGSEYPSDIEYESNTNEQNNRNTNNGPEYTQLNINTSLFKNNKNTGSNLLDNNTIKLITKYDVQMLNVIQSSKKHGEGSFGYVTSAEIEFKFKGYRTKKLIGAMKVSTDTGLLRDGVSADLIKECSTYSRILHSDNLAKGLFSRLNKAKQVMILEHYSINIEDLFEDMALPWDVRAKLIRAVFYQIVNGLNELHALGFIHKLLILLKFVVRIELLPGLAMSLLGRLFIFKRLIEL